MVKAGNSEDDSTENIQFGNCIARKQSKHVDHEQ